MFLERRKNRGALAALYSSMAKGLPEHRIMLIRFNSAGEVQRTPGQTNALGQFTFENLETSKEFEYFVGIRYAGQLYSSEPIRLAGVQHRTGLLVQVVAPSKPTTAETIEPPPFLITNHLVVFGLREHDLEVKEVVRVLRRQAEPRGGTSTTPIPTQGTLFLPLPYGYKNFAGIQGLIPEHMRLLPSGLHFIVPPGSDEYQLVYTYSLPLQTEVSTILIERTLPTTVLDLLVEDAHLFAASDLQFDGVLFHWISYFLAFPRSKLSHRRTLLVASNSTECTSPFAASGRVCHRCGPPPLGDWIVALRSVASTRPTRARMGQRLLDR